MKKAFGSILGSKIPIDVVPPSQEVEDLLKKISAASGSF